MALKRWKPTSPGLRQKVRVDRSHLAKKTKAPRTLFKTLDYKAGRNNQGKITVRHKGGRVKRKYRIIDFKRDKFDVPGKVVSIEYDPYRTAHIALVHYADGEKRFILAPSGLEVGQTIISSKKEVPIQVGNATLLRNIPSGVYVHNVELYPGRGGQLARSAGTAVQVQGQVGKYVQVKLPSGEVRLIHGDCMATIGVVGNEEHVYEKLGKAGVSRYLGIRPTVRGVAMHAQAHPHGGGEGRTGEGRPSKSPWGLRKGTRTRRNKRTDKFIIKRRYEK